MRPYFLVCSLHRVQPHLHVICHTNCVPWVYDRSIFLSLCCQCLPKSRQLHYVVDQRPNMLSSGRFWNSLMLETLLNWNFSLQLYCKQGNWHGGKASSPTGKNSCVWKLYFELPWGTCSYFGLIAVAWMSKNPDQRDLQLCRICCNSLHMHFLKMSSEITVPPLCLKLGSCSVYPQRLCKRGHAKLSSCCLHCSSCYFYFVSHTGNFFHFQGYLNSPIHFSYLQDEEWCKEKAHKANQSY